MGSKGSASKEEKQAAAEALTDDLQPVGEVTSKSMFGDHGIFHDGVMFAMVDSEAHCHLRADDTTSPAFEEAGSERFDPRMPYWGIPEAVRSDQDRLTGWATTALAVAKAAKKK